MTSKNKASDGVRAAEIVREYGPFPGVGSIGGVTHDGRHVWAAAGAARPVFRCLDVTCGAHPSLSASLTSPPQGGRAGASLANNDQPLLRIEAFFGAKAPSAHSTLPP